VGGGGIKSNYCEPGTKEKEMDFKNTKNYSSAKDKKTADK
jgi:hypothetical protein